MLRNIIKIFTPHPNQPTLSFSLFKKATCINIVNNNNNNKNNNNNNNNNSRNFSNVILKSENLIIKEAKMSTYNHPIINERSKRMVWVDLEMTGLDISKDVILEMAIVITDAELNVIEKGPNLVIHRSEEVLKNMNDWCIEHHGKDFTKRSGLTEDVRNSKISLEEAEKIMLEFVRKHTDKGICPLAGNTVHEDRRFLLKEMPTFAEHLHYRIIDVSTIKELSRRWYPYIPSPKKVCGHRALQDIEESIEELKSYRVTVFK
ncbi:hypothetical protein ACTA71_012488 [Dictyostelium dimigraforme]